MPLNTATLFISAVTDEFKSYRDAAVRWLDRPGMRIETQERFLAAGRTTLVKLSDYIRQCDAVVHLVGDRTGDQKSGGIVDPPAIECLLEAHRDLPHALGLDPDTVAQLSYTQWEAWLAIYHRKRLFIAVPEPTAPRDATLADAAKAQAQQESQRKHLAALAMMGYYPEIRFGTSDQLCLGLVPLRDILGGGYRNELGLTNIVSLADYRASLTGFRRFLSSVNLPFQAPARGTPFHPEELLKSLETSVDGRGVLLAGAGGVGKTRITFETAQVAESKGWRVFFALAGQPAVTAERIMEAVLAHGPGKTLVVIEYLDQMEELDLGVLRRHLIQTSSRHGIQFGLLANCRPGYTLKPHPERDATFDTVTLALSAAEARQLSRYVAVYPAPAALAVLGEAELVRVCGDRPIIALLVSQQLEQLALASQLDPRDVRAVRSGDLAHWLRRRLAEDGLVVPQAESIWQPACPPPHLVAAAAALACAPDEEAGLIAAAASALGVIGQPTSTAPRVTAVLVAVGWLEREGPWLHVVHDVVADELAEQAIFELESIRTTELHALLSPAMGRARSFGRLAKMLTRLEGALAGPKAELLRASVGAWLRTHAREIGRTLSDDEPDNGSYALGAVLGGSMLADSAIEEWAALVTPWLEKHRDRFEARHLLFRGLRSRQDSVLSELIPTALAWLKRWQTELDASFVGGQLLRIIPGDHAEGPSLLAWALAWVDRFNDKPEARYVLDALLGRADLGGETAGQAVRLGLLWLAGSADKPEAGYVLHSLLGRADLRSETAVQAVRLGLLWLAGFADKPEADYVLHSLLGRADLKGETARQAMRLALQWLAGFADKSEAQYVLAPLLGRSDLIGETAVQAVRLALQWLAGLPGKPEAQFVLAPLLARSDLKAETACQAVRLALQWLENSPQASGADFVLKALLGRSDLEDKAADQAVRLALQWLAGLTDKPEAGFVLAPLLGRSDLRDETAGQAVRLALKWLENSLQTSGADFVLKTLLGRSDLRDELVVHAVNLALHWLENSLQSSGADFVLKTLLGRSDLTGKAAGQAVRLALQWLAGFTDKPEAGYVLAPLLGRSDLTGDSAVQAVRLALQWLAGFTDKPEAQFVFHSLLGRPDLTGESAGEAVRLALKWLAGLADKPEAQFVLNPLLGRSDLRGESTGEAVRLALQWLAGFADKPDARFVLHALLGRSDLRGESAVQAVKLALQWLEVFGEGKAARFVLVPLLRSLEAFPAAVELTHAVAERVETWISIWKDIPEAGFVFVEWFASKRSSLSDMAHLRETAAAWASLHGAIGSGGPAISLQLSLCSATAPEAPALVAKARTWVNSHGGHPCTVSVLNALLVHHPERADLRNLVIDQLLDTAWRLGVAQVRQLLSLAVKYLPDGDLRREEIEVMLSDETQRFCPLWSVEAGVPRDTTGPRDHGSR